MQGFWTLRAWARQPLQQGFFSPRVYEAEVAHLERWIHPTADVRQEVTERGSHETGCACSGLRAGVVCGTCLLQAQSLCKLWRPVCMLATACSA